MAIIRPEQLSSGSYNITGSFTGSFRGDGSQLTGIVSSKWSGSNPITRVSDVEITGSLRVTGGVTSSLFGTSSWAVNALTASYLSTYIPPFPFTGSAVISGSLSVIGPTNLSGTTGSTIFSSDADTLVITGSLLVTGSMNLVGLMTGTASFAISASYIDGGFY